MTQQLESPVIERIIAPLSDCFTQEVAERVANYRIDHEVQARIDDLARKSNEDSLSEAEQAEYDGYVETIDFIGLLQAQARALLKRSAS
jgi:hypothetical protein